MVMEVNGMQGAKETPDITVIILTYNEAIHIERCIRSVQPIARKIFVVDSFSTDRTVEIARSLGSEVVQHPWKNYADQFQWAIDHCQAVTQWLMRLDADEYLEPELQQEIPELLEELSNNVDGIYIRRKVFFFGKWIRYGGFYPHVLLRIWRTGKGNIEQRWADEHIILPSDSKTVKAKGHLVDDNLNGITFWINKHNYYASKEAVDLLNMKYPLLEHDERIKLFDDPQARRKRILKESLYARLPLGLRATLYFIYRYVLRLGFLDGAKGFFWHFMQGFWYRLLVDVKILEIESRSSGNIEKMRQIIRQEHGLDI